MFYRSFQKLFIHFYPQEPPGAADTAQSKSPAG